MMPALARAMVLFCVAAEAAAQNFVVPPELWDRPRSARGVLEQPSIRKAAEAYLAQPAARVVIHHAASQEGLLQAEELRAWLMALAIEAAHISLRGGLRPPEPVSIEVVAQR